MPENCSRNRSPSNGVHPAKNLFEKQYRSDAQLEQKQQSSDAKLERIFLDL